MDARQNFYNHNRLLFRFLVLSTIVFIGIVTLLWWQEAQEGEHVPASVGTLRHFSAEAAMAEVTSAYAYDARHIHDPESYPELAAAFFNPVLQRELGETTLEERLAEVVAARSSDTVVGRSHVYHTSYYVGNLLIAPGKTVHSLLVDESRGRTALLLETALADLRAGIIKIQQHYDVAPPTWYLGATTSAVFYPTPSFPSLTVSEASLVLYLLAKLGPDQARLYEYATRVFASQAFATGEYFHSDIEYAIKLAEIYATLIYAEPGYQDLIVQAAKEWGAEEADTTQVVSWPVVHDFYIPEFPIPSQFAYTVDGEYLNPMVDVDEELHGRLRLTLVDTRLPQSTVRLYEYDLAGAGLILPYALELIPRQFPELGSSLGYADYISTTEYVFLSGSTRPHSHSGYELASSSLFWRAEGKNPVKISVDDSEIAGRPVHNSAGTQVLLPVVTRAGGAEIKLIELGATRSEPVTAARGYSPSFIDSDTWAYIRSGSAYTYSVLTDTEMLLQGLPVLTEQGRMHYDVTQKVLVVTDTVARDTSLVPESTVQVYTIAKGEADEYQATLLHTLTLTDAVVEQAVLSPGGRYGAISLTEGTSGRRPRVLLYDTNSGIIKKEIDLSSFAPVPIELDGWTLF